MAIWSEALGVSGVGRMSESHQIRDAGIPLSPGLETPSATLPTATPGLARRTACLVIALVVTIGYANSLNCGFAQDDVYVTFNRTLRDLLHIYRAFAQPYWGTGYEELATYRPVVNISLALNYAVHGFHPLGYHFVNLVLHAFNCCLLYGLVYAYTRWSQLALFTALLFAAHPVHVEAVTQVVGRTELLAAGFGFLSWHAYLRIGEGRHWRWLAWAAFAGGMYAKESALTLIGVIGLAELCAGRLRTRQEWQRAALDATGYLVVAASYILIRRLVNGQFGVHGDQTFFHGDPWHTRFLTMAQGMVEYFRLLVFPYRLCAFYDFSFFPKVSTLTPRGGVTAVGGSGHRGWSPGLAAATARRVCHPDVFCLGVAGLQHRCPNGYRHCRTGPLCAIGFHLSSRWAWIGNALPAVTGWTLRGRRALRHHSGTDVLANHHPQPRLDRQ